MSDSPFPVVFIGGSLDGGESATSRAGDVSPHPLARASQLVLYAAERGRICAFGHRLVPQLFPRALPAVSVQIQKPSICSHFRGVSEGTRTPDRLDHNQELYQLSYAHHAMRGKV